MNAPDDATPVAALVRVRGLVQGVCFRDGCERHARLLGVTGWVRNRSDGSVEAMLQGSPRQITDLCDWLRDGVPAARVDDVQVTPVESSLLRFHDFRRRPTA